MQQRYKVVYSVQIIEIKRRTFITFTNTGLQKIQFTTATDVPGMFLEQKVRSKAVCVYLEMFSRRAMQCQLTDSRRVKMNVTLQKEIEKSWAAGLHLALFIHV